MVLSLSSVGATATNVEQGEWVMHGRDPRRGRWGGHQVADVVAAPRPRLDAANGPGAVAARDDAAALAAACARDAIAGWSDAADAPDRSDGEGLDRRGRPAVRGRAASARTECPSATGYGRRPLRAAGVIVVAKTQSSKDYPIHGRCVHPADPPRTPGASSSGEAALIGAGASPLGLGSDPGEYLGCWSAWCGVAGLKPSFGLVPNTGHFPARQGPQRRPHG